MRIRKLKYFSLYFVSIFAIFCLSSCKTPSIKNVSEFKDSPVLSSEVQFQESDNFKPNDINCIAIGKFEDFSDGGDYKNLNKSSLVRSAFYGALARKIISM